MARVQHVEHFLGEILGTAQVVPRELLGRRRIRRTSFEYPLVVAPVALFEDVPLDTAHNSTSLPFRRVVFIQRGHIQNATRHPRATV